MNLTLLFVALCAHFGEGKFSLTQESARGKMKLKNFYHLHGHRLKVSPQATLEVAKDIKCTASCMRNTDCFSFNVKKLSSNLFLCEFLNTSKFLDSKNLMRDENFVHWYLQEPCKPSPCGNESQGKCVENSDGTAWSCVRIFDTELNYALNKPATQKTEPGVAWKAVDGNSNRFWVGGSCTRTQVDITDPQWWRVDLGEEIPVSQVVITNRADCCGYRLGNFAIKIGNSLDSDGLSNSKCAGDHLSIPTGGTKTFVCTPWIRGQYVVVQSYLNDLLTLCEVKVYAYPKMIV